MDSKTNSEALERALRIVRKAITPHGFLTAATGQHNYQRIWSRDSVVISLAALQTDDEELHTAAKASLQTLCAAQGPQGQIPSNVDPVTGEISYGGTAGRVDASLWFVVGTHQYWQTTGDDQLLSDFLSSLEKIEYLLAAWEFNSKGLLYVPETGDWADEYIQHGYVLYDQLLYWRALQDLARMYEALGKKGVAVLRDKAERLKNLIIANYWFFDCEAKSEFIYHPLMFKRGCSIAENKGAYWLAFFSPASYGYRFDAFANVLVSLFGIADEAQRNATAAFIEENVLHGPLKVMPAFSPVITPIDRDWPALQSNFSNTFKNKPYHYHNGGLWPMLTGLYVAERAKYGHTEQAEEYLAAIHQANQLDREEGGWGFYEFINGETFEPGGTRHQTWSASAAMMGHYALHGKQPLDDHPS